MNVTFQTKLNPFQQNPSRTEKSQFIWVLSRKVNILNDDSYHIKKNIENSNRFELGSHEFSCMKLRQPQLKPSDRENLKFRDLFQVKKFICFKIIEKSSLTNDKGTTNRQDQKKKIPLMHFKSGKPSFETYGNFIFFSFFHFFFHFN